MGGVKKNENFILNCSDWSELYKKYNIASKIDAVRLSKCDFGIAPVTGAVQNIGFECEKDFYFPYIKTAFDCGIAVCVGDGVPDEKVEFGIEAVEMAVENFKAVTGAVENSSGVAGVVANSYGDTVAKKIENTNRVMGRSETENFKAVTGAFYFLKPFENEKLFSRIEKIKKTKTALAIGVDIDAYNIVTMRNQVHLEKKTASQLIAIREFSKLPLMIKGVFTADDIKLCEEVQPEIIVASNHGGRVETEKGSTAVFLEKNASKLKKYCSELWVDGGIRCATDAKVAKFLGANKILVGRPFISALCKGGKEGMKRAIEVMYEK